MFHKVLSLLPFVVVVMSQTVDVSFFNGAGCSSFAVAWQALSTDNWDGVAPNTFVHAMAGPNETFEECSIDLGTLSSGVCFDTGSPTGITSSQFFNGGGETLEKRDDASGCTPHPIDIYYYSPGDGFQYIIYANNSAHSSAIHSAKSNQVAEQYIVANFDKKVPISA
ncbi:hypothetical protein EW026_g3021 [Hermanssonia centrifuga]|uniref:Uncharacterized protein n=1 Tax=Hermanssonia centrifuga TaxID=98765 RepID=A0A4S4KM00_9APHY|nr:hypothetical protein EW026_g3021 [Hermanssonia centrifuga]